MTLEEILKEYEKGCSNTIDGKPSDCTDCLAAAVSAIKFWYKKEHGWESINDF